MRTLKNKKKFSGCARAAGFFVLCAVLTGCTGREAEFLAEGIREAKAEVDAEEAKAGEKEEADEEVSKESKEDGENPDFEASEGRSAENRTVLTEEPQEPAEIYVDVCGAVAEPGVFKLEEGSRVFQAIEAAGGVLPEAADAYINQACLLEDGQQIYVPTKEETAGTPFPGAGSAGGNGETAGGSASDGKVNLNTADEAALMTLTGIGAARAQAIISYREEHGPFSSIEDIMNVQGIKEGTFTNIKDEIVVG